MKVEINGGLFALVNDEDCEFLSQWKWHLSGGYVQRTFRTDNGRVLSAKMHREVLKRSGMDLSGKIVDHINFNKLDNRRENLRLATSSQSNAHKKPQLNNTSGYKGVSWDKSKGKWKAAYAFRKKDYHIGYFNDVIEAARAYNEIVKVKYNNYAYLNEL